MKKLVALTVLFSSSMAQADIASIESTFKTCAENSRSTLESNDCSRTAYAQADAELNRVYQAIRSSLQVPTTDEYSMRYNAAAQKRLLAAQRAWITYRDTSCDESGLLMFEGSGEGIIYGGCLATKTIERVKDLQNIYQIK